MAQEQETLQVYDPDQLYHLLKNERPLYWDTTRDTTSIQAIRHKGDIALQMPNKEETGDGVYTLTHWAQTQLADKMGIPWKYYNRMLTEKKTQLLADNINAWMQTKDKRTFRMKGDTVRAVVSDIYSSFDNLDLYKIALLEIQEQDAVIHECSLTDRHMYIKALMPYNELEIVKNDSVVPGIILSNSEVAAGKTKVELFLLRKVCSNGMIGEQVFGKTHIGGRRENGIIDYSRKVETLQNKLDKQKITELMHLAFNTELHTEWTHAIKNGVDFTIEHRADAIKSLSSHFNFTKEEDSNILNILAEQRKANKWTISQSVTQCARDTKDYERKVELERIGGDIAVMPDARLDAVMKMRNLQKELERE